MALSRIDLARKIDMLSDAERATVTESRTELALYQLEGADARCVIELLNPAGFRLTRLADDGGNIPADYIDDESTGIELVAAKPAVPAGVFPILTMAGLARLLDRAPTEPIIWINALEKEIETFTTAYVPWGTVAIFTPAEEPPDPARVVRSFSDSQPPEKIGRWLLRDPSTEVSSPLLQEWRRRASVTLCKAIAQEIEHDDRIFFRGPPTTRFATEGAEEIEAKSMAALQRAALWVFQNPRELENRHGLFAAEVARTAVQDGDLGDLAAITQGALEGAKIAYDYGISQQSREVLETLSDMRKSVSDETQKLSEHTRSLASAVLTSTVANVSLIIARLTFGKNSTFIALAVALISFALAVYVVVMISTGWQFLTIQRDLRTDWRERIYRFLGNSEYKKLVSDPIQKSEKGFRIASIGAALVSALLLLATLLVAFGFSSDDPDTSNANLHVPKKNVSFHKRTYR